MLTFPGVIVHELAHQLFCRWCRVAVFKVVYYQFGNPSGYVLHEKPRYKYQNILISTGPFIVNTILGFLIALPASVQVYTFDTGNPLDYLLIYLGFSIAMHAFPSTGDAQALWASVNDDEETSTFLKIIATPIVGLIYIGAVGSVIWLDALYGFFVTLLLPNWIVSAIA